MKKTIHPAKRFGNIAIPSSKSDGQRALLAAALAKGESILHNVGDSHDEMSMLETIQTLGATIAKKKSNTLIIQGIKKFPTHAEINIGESGLGVRLITSICAAHEGVFLVSGKGSLEKRPLTFFL